VCVHCLVGEVEDVYQWLMKSPAWSESRAKLIDKVNCLLDVPDPTKEEVADFVKWIGRVPICNR
jgi:hypothetical protein